MGSAVVPATKPRQTRAETETLVIRAGVTEPVVLLGVRGYYRDTMGRPSVNDRGLYDDALFVLSPDVHAAFNANTDPSVYRKGIAVLKAGVWRYKKGKHKIADPNGYPALVQAAPVTVLRDGVGDDTGYFGINIHRGSRTSTSSLGCQTIYPSQWDAFINLVYGEMVRWHKPVVPYVLVEGAA